MYYITINVQYVRYRDLFKVFYYYQPCYLLVVRSHLFKLPQACKTLIMILVILFTTTIPKCIILL